MRVLPSGTTALLIELDDLDHVLGLYAALVENLPQGVLDVVPAASTLLVVIDPAVTSLSSVENAVRHTTPRDSGLEGGERVDIPVTYDGQDLEEAAQLLGCDSDELVRRHTSQVWTVAFTGFAPGFGYMTSEAWQEEVPRRASPRKKVPAGSVGLGGGFTGVYPRESPGGWQLIGRTELAMFDPSREPAALLRPGTRVQFSAEDRR
ncbi:MAG: 5-oxoprolinase subunit PxpB [Actinomycetota bacterium]|nr:5-oxoprolinase subunit PxpB [Actinomycetota bacterium]